MLLPFNRIKSNQMNATQIDSNQNQSHPNQTVNQSIESNNETHQIKINQNQSNPINPINSSQLRTLQITSHKTKSNQIKSNQMKSSQINLNQIHQIKTIQINQHISNLSSKGLSALQAMSRPFHFMAVAVRRMVKCTQGGPPGPRWHMCVMHMMIGQRKRKHEFHTGQFFFDRSCSSSRSCA